MCVYVVFHDSNQMPSPSVTRTQPAPQPCPARPPPSHHSPGRAATILSYFLFSPSISRVLRSISSARRLRSDSNLTTAASCGLISHVWAAVGLCSGLSAQSRVVGSAAGGWLGCGGWRLEVELMRLIGWLLVEATLLFDDTAPHLVGQLSLQQRQRLGQPPVVGLSVEHVDLGG
jgi:hypothetical protein